MSDTNKNGSAVAQIVTGVVVALLVGGTAPWWWQEFFSKKEPEPEPTVSVEPEPEPTVSVEPEPEPANPRKTTISVAYKGDYYACSLPISISVADQKFYPQGNIYQISDIELGQQRYQISGQINCPTIGSCQVFGEGTIDVVPNGVYYVIWRNTAWGQCSAILQANV